MSRTGESPAAVEHRAPLAWRDVLLVALPALAIAAVLVMVVQLLRPAPPDLIRILGGPPGSIFATTAERYRGILQRYGVRVQVISTAGSLANLQRLVDKHGKADVGLVQSGLADGVDVSGLVSLGTMFAQPLIVYYRHPQVIDVLSQLKGKRLAIGAEGSGTHALAARLLAANGLAGPPTTVLSLAGDEAARGLVAGTVDAVFLMGDSANPRVMGSLRDVPGVRMMSFRQAAGYARKFPFLTRLTLPEGALDLGTNHPPQATELIGPTVELVARKDLHPALSDLLIAAAREVHGSPALFRDAGEYPNPQARDFPLSADAERYYKSGEQFLYKRLPFWLASLLDRILVVIVPLLVLIVPASRLAPAIYRWRVRARLLRWYAALQAIERERRGELDPEERARLQARLDEIDAAVHELRIPTSFADQLYVLREHVTMVRRRLFGHE